MVSSTEVWWPFDPPSHFNSIIRCFTMCLETRIFPCGINWNHKYHAYCVFWIHICFRVLYVLMIKLVPGRWCPSGQLYGLAPAMCGPRHVVLYFPTLLRTMAADFLWIRTTRQAKKYIFFIFWSWGWFRCHGNQIRTRRWHTEVCALPYPNINIHFLISSGDLKFMAKYCFSVRPNMFKMQKMTTKVRVETSLWNVLTCTASLSSIYSKLLFLITNALNLFHWL